MAKQTSLCRVRNSQSLHVLQHYWLFNFYVTSWVVTKTVKTVSWHCLELQFCTRAWYLKLDQLLLKGSLYKVGLTRTCTSFVVAPSRTGTSAFKATLWQMISDKSILTMIARCACHATLSLSAELCSLLWIYICTRYTKFAATCCDITGPLIRLLN